MNLPPSVPAVVSRPKKKTSESESVEQLGKKPTSKPRPYERSAYWCLISISAVDRLKLQAEEDVVLSPQRRSFGAGCHVTGKRNASPRE